jgi:threonine dehydrogenase-like Zn-dependent dehydrogenase
MVGCCVARLLAGFPAVRVTLVDVDESRRSIAEALGVRFASPELAVGNQDLVVHTSASSAGLQLALELLATEATVLELSWYGDASSTLALGAAFHSRRLTIRASQVGAVSPARRTNRSTADRLALALELLADPAFDALLTGPATFSELPDLMARLADLPVLCHTISYP